MPASEASDALDRYPTTGGWDRWARATTGNAATPPTRVMKSRRLMPPLSHVAHHSGWRGTRYRRGARAGAGARIAALPAPTRIEPIPPTMRPRGAPRTGGVSHAFAPRP